MGTKDSFTNVITFTDDEVTHLKTVLENRIDEYILDIRHFEKRKTKGNEKLTERCISLIKAAIHDTLPILEKLNSIEYID